MSGSPVIVVSGLPRSGTSLLMRMLAAGGVPVLADGSRPPDADNPYGYFEDARAAALPAEAGWLAEARGRAVKVVSPLLRHLPPGHAYRILLARRDLDEVLASQRAMLRRRGLPADAAADLRLRGACARHLAALRGWLARQPHMAVLEVRFAAVLADPAGEAARVAAFVGGGLDVAAMAAAVDPRLPRHRRPT